MVQRSLSCTYSSPFRKKNCLLTASSYVLLIVSIELIDSAVQNEVDFLCLPAHTSHALQPLYVGVFSVVKKTWTNILKRFYLEKGFQSILKTKFAELLTKIFCDSFKPDPTVAGQVRHISLDSN